MKIGCKNSSIFSTAIEYPFLDSPDSLTYLDIVFIVSIHSLNFSYDFLIPVLYRRFSYGSFTI